MLLNATCGSSEWNEDQRQSAGVFSTTLLRCHSDSHRSITSFYTCRLGWRSSRVGRGDHSNVRCSLPLKLSCGLDQCRGIEVRCRVLKALCTRHSRHWSFEPSISFEELCGENRSDNGEQKDEHDANEHPPVTMLDRWPGRQIRWSRRWGRRSSVEEILNALLMVG